MLRWTKTLLKRATLATAPDRGQAKADEIALLKSKGDGCVASGHLLDAVQAFRSAAALDARNAGVLVPLGHALWRLGQNEEATRTLEAALAEDGRSVDAHYLLALSLKDTGRLSDAIQHFEAVVELDPDAIDVYFALFEAQIQLERPEAAEQVARRGLEQCRRMLDGDASNAGLLNNQGLLLRHLKMSDKALASFEKAIEVNGAFAEALSNRGLVLQDLNRFHEALACHDEALRIKPDFAAALANRGNVLRELVRHRDALASYEKAFSITATLEDFYLNESLSHLVLGDLEAGWQKYEWRWQTTAVTHPKHKFAQPMWLGRESLEGKTIFVHAEQGLGDTIQFCRYARELARLGASVILGVQPALAPILEGLEGVDRLVVPGPPLPAFDYHCPLLSLPLAFGTSLATIPAPGPYIRLDGARFAGRLHAWADRLGPRDKPRIGVVWSGNPKHKNDSNRSIALVDFVEIVSGKARFIALQNELRASDAALLAERADVEYFGPDLVDFGETAALVAQLDLIISVDTSVAHLAAAMGVPVWLLVSRNPDWRWLLDRSDSPWYETVRVFRQTRFGDWSEVLGIVKDEISRLGS